MHSTPRRSSGYRGLLSILRIFHGISEHNIGITVSCPRKIVLPEQIIHVPYIAPHRNRYNLVRGRKSLPELPSFLSLRFAWLADNRNYDSRSPELPAHERSMVKCFMVLNRGLISPACRLRIACRESGVRFRWLWLIFSDRIWDITATRMPIEQTKTALVSSSQ